MAESTQTEEPDLVPARMLNEYVYCPRLAYLEWVQGEFEDNADTVEGRYRHRGVDRERGSLSDPARLEVQDDASGTGLEQVRSVMMSAPELGVISRIDMVELEGGVATPVDYKRGTAPDVPAGAYEPERVQVCAQGLVLRANGYQCNEGLIYFVGSRKRVTVPFDDALVQSTIAAIQDLRRLSRSGQIPPPLEDSPKCPRCSLVGICLPDEVHHLAHGGNGGGDIRRMAPARIEGLPVHVIEQGAVLGKSGETVEIKLKGEKLESLRLIDISQVNLHGNIQVTTPALRELTGRGIPICFFSYGGWFSGIAHGMAHKNVELRRLQYRQADDPERSLELARAFTAGKIRNSRTMLRRNHAPPPRPTLRELARLTREAEHCRAMDSLLGIEGAAARAYFSHFAGMLKSDEPASFDFRSRNRRPPKDPVNAMLSFVYSLLVRDLTVAVLGVGLDPFLGFYHQPRYGRPALALDLAEEFRPIVADSTVIGAINNGEVRASDFVVTPAGASLTARGRRQVIGAYERRMDGLVTHPVFGYPISYRKVFHVQARLLARLLLGEIARYPAFRTR
ncbi:MAG: CRISPR-associated endonuclease Cas1 [Planctomycetota bacterium]